MEVFATKFAHAKGAPGAHEVFEFVVNVTYSAFDRSMLVAIDQQLRMVTIALELSEGKRSGVCVARLLLAASAAFVGFRDR